MKLFKGKKGFTLIELVVVIAILGILAGIAIPRFLDATATARGSKIVADMRTIDSAIVIFNAKTGSMPGASGNLVTSSTDGASYQLLASWPTPPTGKATITGDDGKQHSLTKADTRSYGYDKDAGRATLGGSTVTDILALTTDKAI